MSSLSEEQRLKIEENRRKALLKRAERSKAQSSGSAHTNPRPTHVGFSTTSASSKFGNAQRPSFTAVRQNTVHCNQTSVIRPPRPGSQSASVAQSNSRLTVSKEAFYGSSKPAVTGSCHLISADRFLVDVGYNQEMIAKFQQIPDRRYHPDERHWSFPVSRHEEVMDALKPLRPGVVVAPLPSHVLRCLRRPAPASDSVDLSALDPVLLEALMPFQREGIQMGVARGGRVLLADDMGLGKTIQAIGIASYFHDWPLLIVCPSSMRYQWRHEFLRFLPSQHPSTIVVMDSSKDFSSEARILIVSYDLVSRCAAQLKDVGFLSVIMDESHCLKNPKAARTRAAVPLLRAARRVLLLSGTPALSRPVELYTQISAIDRSFMPVFNDFGLRYCGGQRNAWGWDFSGASRMSELQILLERRIMIRRLKRDVIVQLPAKRRQLVVLDPDQVRCRTKKMSAMETRMGERSLRGSERRGALLEYFRETATAKLPAVCSYLEDLLDSGAKFICFAHHRVVLDAVCELLERRREEHIRIDGTTTAPQRKDACDRFQSGSAVRVAVLSITAASTGLTLTAASLVVFAELFWNPGVLTQAEDRAHRIGQQDSVQVRYLVARGTADDHIWPLVQSKLEVLKSAGLSKDDFTEATQDRQPSREEQRQTLITELFSQLGDEEEPAAAATAEQDGQEAPAAEQTAQESAAETTEGDAGVDSKEGSDDSAGEPAQDIGGPGESDEWMHEMGDDDWVASDSFDDASEEEEPPPKKKARKRSTS